MEAMVSLLFIMLFVGVGIFISGIRIINQYQRGVVLTFGRYTGTREPGFRFVFPGIQQMTLVDVR